MPSVVTVGLIVGLFMFLAVGVAVSYILDWLEEREKRKRMAGFMLEHPYLFRRGR
jgi:hypothetical protein